MQLFSPAHIYFQFRVHVNANLCEAAGSAMMEWNKNVVDNDDG